MSQQAQQQLQQQQRRLSLQPVAGRVAHAAAGPALRPGSAQSQALPAASGAAARQARRSSLPPPPATDRQLRFSSTSAEVVMPPLAAVPEEEEPRTAFKPAAHEPTTAAKPATAAALAELAGQHATATERSPAGAPSPSHLAVAEALVTAGKTPGSGPPPPRELALSVLTGLVVTPLRRGIYEFTEPRYGYVFQLGPGDPEPDSAGKGCCLGRGAAGSQQGIPNPVHKAVACWHVIRKPATRQFSTALLLASNPAQEAIRVAPMARRAAQGSPRRRHAVLPPHRPGRCRGAAAGHAAHGVQLQGVVGASWSHVAFWLLGWAALAVDGSALVTVMADKLISVSCGATLSSYSQ
jgi:hypothetical protein